MQHSNSNSPATGSNNLSRYSAKKMAKPVNFICVAPEAKSVTLVGDFW